ncbi:MAG: L-threonylcarbamoyladenylate synthase [Bacteroidota bacterium]
MFLEIHPENIDQRAIKKIVEVLENDGIIIFPTDSVYSMGCDLHSKKALNRLAQLKNVKLNHANFSIICESLSNLSNFTKPIDRSTFKLLNNYLPGPFTFILNATNEVQKRFDSNRKEIGIRIPNNAIVLEIVKHLGHPIATTSLHNADDEIQEFYSDPSQILEDFENTVDIIIDGGYGNLNGSTVVDCTGEVPEIIRQGLGIIDL